jgi:hypothetical protein
VKLLDFYAKNLKKWVKNAKFIDFFEAQFDEK